MPVPQERFPGAEQRVPAILVVEDEALIRAALSDYLRGVGYAVLEADNAEKAIAILRADAPVELVFSDVRLPGNMDGVALGQWIHENRPSLPVLLTSGDPRRAYPEEALCHDGPFLPKPYDLEEVASRIACLLAAPRLRAI